jgi:hypothetical protein
MKTALYKKLHTLNVLFETYVFLSSSTGKTDKDCGSEGF